MASEGQIAANRRNARKSTGPRSSGGRKRASRNAYRHGLTLSISSTAAFAKHSTLNSNFARRVECRLSEARASKFAIGDGGEEPWAAVVPAAIK
jgi:hypothetical protein